MVICHIMCEFCIVEIKLIVFVSDKSSVEEMLPSIFLKSVEFVLNMPVAVLVLTLGLNNRIVSIEEQQRSIADRYLRSCRPIQYH